MKISSPRSIITFDYENGNVLKAKGRILWSRGKEVLNFPISQELAERV